MSNAFNTEDMIHSFERVMNKYNAWEKKPRHYTEKDLLYRSEVHTIEAIGKNNKINVTELAHYLGITKGAVSQMVDKLIKKNMVSKEMVSPTENEVALELTERGNLVYQAHEKYHEEFYEEISKQLHHLSNESMGVFFEILHSLEKFLDNKNQT